jgi:hypothetical protein
MMRMMRAMPACAPRTMVVHSGEGTMYGPPSESFITEFQGEAICCISQDVSRDPQVKIFQSM